MKTIKQLFLLVALCATQVSFGMQPDQNKFKNKLRHAAADGDLKQVKQLLAAGVDPNGSVHGFECPLAAAVRKGHFEICQALIDAGADVNWVDESVGLTSLMLIGPGDGKILRLLLAAGADVYAVSASQMTPLMCASASFHRKNVGNFEVCELLLQYGADHDRGKRAIDRVRELLVRLPHDAQELGKVIALLEDPEKIRAVIMRADNPRAEMKPWRKSEKNIFNALMNRELGRK